MHSGNKPEWMILTEVPVIRRTAPAGPARRRPIATSDLNDLYRASSTVTRLKRLMELRAPDIIIRTKSACCRNRSTLSRQRPRPLITGANKAPAEVLADMLKGKQGASARTCSASASIIRRSVIVVGPELKLHQCAAKKMRSNCSSPSSIRASTRRLRRP